MRHWNGLQIIQTETCPPNTVFLIPPAPRREDYPSQRLYVQAVREWEQGCGRIENVS